MAKYIIVGNDELYHHGIKGQKWGIRRYQNEDGTRTEEGKNRYYKFKNKMINTGHKIRDFMTYEDKKTGKRKLTKKGQAVVLGSELALTTAIGIGMLKLSSMRTEKMRDQTILNCKIDEACAKAGVTGELKEQIRKMVYNSWNVKIPENYKEITGMNTVANQIRLL